jgi:hypothetical protein
LKSWLPPVLSGKDDGSLTSTFSHFAWRIQSSAPVRSKTDRRDGERVEQRAPVSGLARCFAGFVNHPGRRPSPPRKTPPKMRQFFRSSCHGFFL